MTTPLQSNVALRTRDGVKFGKELREKEFLFGKEWVNLNHGSFGTYPRVVRDAMRSYQDRAEARPDQFIRYEYSKILDESREAVAKILNAPTDTVVFVANATTGINLVLRNLTYAPGDYILYFSTIYTSCNNTIEYVKETTQAKSIEVKYTYPVEDDWLVEEFKRKVAEVESTGGRVKIAVFDTVVSVPGVRVPFEALTAACKEAGILSCVDGAHGVGHVELDLAKLDPDFFVSNCHKWIFAPRGCAVFYVPARNQPLIRSTLPTSRGFAPKVANVADPLPKDSLIDANKTPFVAKFEFVGTIDCSPYLVVKTALEWREKIGGEEKIREYCFTLAKQAAQHVAEVLGTEAMDNKTETLSQCCMANVRLPISVVDAQNVAAKAGLEVDDVGSSVRDWVSKTLVDDYNTFVQMMFYNGAWWARLSAQVYLEMSDFEWAAQTLKKVSERANSGEWAVVESKL